MSDKCKTFICPICFEETKTAANLFLRHCGHYMVEMALYFLNVPGFLKARERELGELHHGQTTDG